MDVATKAYLSFTTPDALTKDVKDLSVLSNSTAELPGDDVKELAASYMMYKIGVALDKSYFLFLVPPGVIGNILSFLVMTQKHNRHMSFSLYISALALTDNMSLLIGFTRYLNNVQDMDMPPSQNSYCTLSMAVLYMTGLCSTLFILNMTFDRFYSIIRPHKAASFNTVKRAKITIVCIILFSIIFNIPHFLLTVQNGKSCIPFGKARQSIIGQFYHWFSMFLNFALPFVLLLTMNCVIIHTIRNRSLPTAVTSEGQGQGEGQKSKIKSSEMQIYVILLLVAFGFLILTTPAYAMFIYVMFYDYEKSAYTFAGFTLFYSIAQKTYYTNYGINFFLYVISGKKFRSDLMRLFKCTKESRYADSSGGSQNTEETRQSSDFVPEGLKGHK